MVVGSSGEDIMEQEVAGNDTLGHHGFRPRAGVPDPSGVAGDFDQVVDYADGYDSPVAFRFVALRLDFQLTGK